MGIATYIMFLLSLSSIFQWVVVNDYSLGRDVALALCIYSYKLYVFGFDEIDGVSSMRAEIRDAASGSLLRVWRGSMGTLYDCFVVDNNIYAVGTLNVSGNDFGWIIIAFDEELNIVSMVLSNPFNGMDIATSIYSDGEYIYVSGIVNGSNFNGYRVEKRSKDLYSLEAVYMVNTTLSWRWSYALPKIAEDLDGFLWLLYLYVDESTDIEITKIDILDKNLVAVKTINIDNVKGYPYSLTFDLDRHAYVGGSMGILKIDYNGNVLKLQELKNYIIFRITYIDKDRIAAFGSRIIVPPYIAMNNLLLFNKDLDILANITISTNSPWILWTGRMERNRNNLYIAASEYKDIVKELLNEAWSVYSVNISAIDYLYMQRNENLILQLIPIIIVVIFSVVLGIISIVVAKRFKAISIK